MDGHRTGPEDAARRLLKEAEILYERHRAGRVEPFNVFTVLRSSSDEVNLHSRFLHALLDYRKPGEDGRANLEDFVTKFRPGFAPDGAEVERERHNVDILITNRSGQALAIENKIYAADQDGQIKRYYCKLVGRGYKDVHVLYLTIDGRAPSDESVDRLGKEKYSPIAYEEILGWLKHCQKRAYDEPALRESVAQYLHLIKKMTGNDQGSEYMNKLRDLLSQGNNLLIAHDLEKAAIDARVHAMRRVWQEIEQKLRENPNSFGDPKEPSKISEDRIRGAVEGQKGMAGWFGLYYSSILDHALFGVEATRVGFMVGVRCEKGKYEDQYKRIHEKFAGMGMDRKPNYWWPVSHVVRSDGVGLRADTDDLVALSTLSNDPKAREKLVSEIYRNLEKIRERLNSKS